MHEVQNDLIWSVLFGSESRLFFPNLCLVSLMSTQRLIKIDSSPSTFQKMSGQKF